MRLRVVVLEDEPTVREFLWAILGERGYEVLAYPDAGLCPLNGAAECPCPGGVQCADAILTDIRMPVTNGIDFIEHLIEIGCKRPHFAIMSGSWTDSEAERAARLGCRMLRKPFQVNDVIEWLESVEQSVPAERRLLDWQPSIKRGRS